MLDENTMFYHYADWSSDYPASCIWRAVARDLHPNKKWTVDNQAVTCTSSTELKNNGIFSINPSAFYDADNLPWLVYGSDFGGVWLTRLDENNTGKVKGNLMKVA